MIVFAYMDEWDKTIKALKLARCCYLNQGSDGSRQVRFYSSD